VALFLTPDPIDSSRFGEQTVTLRPKPDRRRAPRRIVPLSPVAAAGGPASREMSVVAQARRHAADDRQP